MCNYFSNQPLEQPIQDFKVAQIFTLNLIVSFDHRYTFCTGQIAIGGKRKRAKVVSSCPTPSPVRVSIYVDSPPSFFVLPFPTSKDPPLYTSTSLSHPRRQAVWQVHSKNPHFLLFILCVFYYVTGACRWSSCEALMNGRSLLTLEP